MVRMGGAANGESRSAGVLALLAVALALLTLGYGFAITSEDGGLDGERRKVHQWRLLVARTLWSASTAHMAYAGAYGRYSECAIDLGFLPLTPTPFTYYLGRGGLVVDPLAPPDPRFDVPFRTDPQRSVILPALPRSARRADVPFEKTGCPVTPLRRLDGSIALDGPGVLNRKREGGGNSAEAALVVAAANLDDDPALDCWSISRADAKSFLDRFPLTGDSRDWFKDPFWGVIHEQDDLAE